MYDGLNHDDMACFNVSYRLIWRYDSLREAFGSVCMEFGSTWRSDTCLEDLVRHLASCGSFDKAYGM